MDAQHPQKKPEGCGKLPIIPVLGVGVKIRDPGVGWLEYLNEWALGSMRDLASIDAVDRTREGLHHQSGTSIHVFIDVRVHLHTCEHTHTHMKQQQKELWR